MPAGYGAVPEIESLNLSDLDISALDARLEMTNILPSIIVCIENCNVNCTCYNVDGCTVYCDVNTTCNCNALD
jgi:hypothetical protein